MIDKARELIQSLCDADDRHPMSKERVITLEFMQSLHNLTKIDTTTEYGIKKITDNKEEVIH